MGVVEVFFGMTGREGGGLFRKSRWHQKKKILK